MEADKTPRDHVRLPARVVWLTMVPKYRVLTSNLSSKTRGQRSKLGLFRSGRLKEVPEQLRFELFSLIPSHLQGGQNGIDTRTQRLPTDTHGVSLEHEVDPRRDAGVVACRASVKRPNAYGLFRHFLLSFDDFVWRPISAPGNFLRYGKCTSFGEWLFSWETPRHLLFQAYYRSLQELSGSQFDESTPQDCDHGNHSSQANACLI